MNETGYKITKGCNFELSSENNAAISLKNDSFFDTVEVSDYIFFGDGELKCEVISNNGRSICLHPHLDAHITNGVSIGIKGKDFLRFSISEQQIAETMELSNKYRINLILSFVDHVNRLKWARNMFDGAFDIVPKIETCTALKNFNSIAEYSNTIFIGRGDLGLSVGIEKIGIVQRELIKTAKDYKCKVALGTGTLDSLKWSQIPLRAEIVDITNSTLSGVEYIVLTSETGGSKTPFESINYLAKTLDYLSCID